MTEGWTWIIGSPKWHYIRENMSLCNKWLMPGKPELEQGKNDSPDNCKACRRILEKENAKRQLTESGKKATPEAA